jgi:pyruvate kinase
MQRTLQATRAREATDTWDADACRSVIDELWQIRAAMLDYQARLAPWLTDVHSEFAASAANLAHYLALRHFDLRRLQEQLARIGVSSLGRAETHVLANLDKVLGILHRLVGRAWTSHKHDEPAGFRHGQALLASHTDTLFGAAPPERSVRIMVTLPSEAATDPKLANRLVRAGMDIARINCAHDEPRAWVAMAEHVRKAARSLGRPVRILADLGGPKLRTGCVAGEPTAMKLKPERNGLGIVVAPLRLGLRALGSGNSLPGAATTLDVQPDWLGRLRVGDVVRLTDARSANRRLVVVERRGASAMLECAHTVYLVDGIRLRHCRRRRVLGTTTLFGVPHPQSRLRLRRGDTVRLVREAPAHRPAHPARGKRRGPPTIVCTLPAVLDQVANGERIWFDDGHLGGVIRRTTAAFVEVVITEAPAPGAFLAPDKGINFPESNLDIPAMSAKDISDLELMAPHADMVALSFAQSAADLEALRSHLQRLGAQRLGVVLKIETRRGFEHLPQQLFALMRSGAAGVMIARGDLAVECGFERLAEVQEEILWACEAAHIPVVWATQVLETLARTGMPSRAEITDAAMGERAECVMLNKGPYVVDAVRALDNILRRMQAHQSKKRPLLRALKAWTMPIPSFAAKDSRA